MSKALIKWNELSRKLSDSDNSIRPNKYERKVKRLILLLKLWLMVNCMWRLNRRLGKNEY